jgi:hypothetical protein
MPGACDALMLADQEHAYAMEEASKRLVRRIRIEQGLERRAPSDLRAEGMIWHRSCNGSALNQPRYTREVLVKLAERDTALARVVKRDPCPLCGVRADFGCKHGRAA